ncbi:MAG: folylpolyglutamate synthase/dihydrofolate synthase family protein [Lachnospiraceae bacterium]|nr:folylpolyglutamate synthase/dihydrofolate synthase family protein [Lachnospiraceae bacterium]
MTYESAVKYIEALEIFGAKLDLSRIFELLSRLGNPHEGLKVIHVAGTNGKGSVSSMIASVLFEAGYKTGVYTSPHLVSYNERYTINNKNISDELFAKYIGKIKNICLDMEKQGIGHPTPFEVLTAAAFCFFNDEKVDIAVLEVGLGGRFDATNVIASPILSVIASVSYDHMEFLGYTLDKIAYEKGGIIKENSPVALYRQSEEVYNVIYNICKEKKSKLYYPRNQKINIISKDLNNTVFSVSNEYISYENVKLNLLGDYQIENSALVLLCFKALADAGLFVPRNIILKGVEKAFWPGRMEKISDKPLVFLDGAHNIEGIRMLVSSIKGYFEGRNIILLTGVLADKEYEEMYSLIAPLAKHIVVTKPNSSRGLSAEKLAETIKKSNKNITTESDIKKAYIKALNLTEKDDVLVCAGSLYLIGEIKKTCLGGY